MKVIYFTCFVFFFFNDTATTEIYTLSLHDALPISRPRPAEAIACLPGLLPLLLPPRKSRARRRGAELPRTRRGARLHPRPLRNLGSDPDRRRSADAGAAPAGGADRGPRCHRARRHHPHPQPRADRRAL